MSLYCPLINYHVHRWMAIEKVGMTLIVHLETQFSTALPLLAIKGKGLR